ncbi:MAG: 16S rRNA (uracil(1498)-N(3))-methyltransferase [Gammaproteobacteria bacterium]|nr:16S rRNA (uracil(1498)-N(3))-methyltransferase [Gammaproteobacteria bacterium]
MREPRIFVDCDLQEDSELKLVADTAHYVATVLRRKVGQKISLFNGRGSDYPASIESVSKKEVLVQIASSKQVETESNLRITLLQGISRAQHMDYTLQKVVELGVHRIVPVFTEFGNLRIDDERAQKKWQHWRKILISACEQSGRAYIPELAKAQSLTTALAAQTNSSRMILHPAAGLSLGSMTAPANSMSILAGPEGGFSENELEQASAQKFQSIVLGPRVLRTETAAVAAISICQSLWGDMN